MSSHRAGQIAFFAFLAMTMMFYGVVLVYNQRNPNAFLTTDEIAKAGMLERCRQFCLGYGLVPTGHLTNDAKAFLREVKPNADAETLEQMLSDVQFTPTASQASALLGLRALEFVLQNDRGENVSLNEVNARGPVVLAVQEGSPVVAPRTVTIPAGQASATFYLDALDDVLVDGTQNAKVVARVRETGSTRTLEVGTASATIAVTDDDGPALFLSIDRDLANEGVAGAALVTITRNTPPEADLVVTLASSDETELTVPTNVVIPAGQTSVTVAVDTLDDGAVDGNQFVSITASAAGYAAASDSIIVSDADLPDLVPTPPTGPERVSTDAFFSLSYRIDNPGFSSAIASNADGEFPGSWVDRVFLSPDNAIGDDILVGSFTFQGTLPVGLFYAREITARAPRAAGDYWIVVVTDVSEQVGEGVETNNARISEQPVHVVPAYTARVQTAVDVGIAGERVLLTGTATMAAGGPAIASIVNVHVGFQGTTRVVSALTNFAGQFQVSLETFPGQGGLYTIGAAHPGDASAPVQDQFTLLGLDAALDQTSRQVLEGDSFTGAITVTNDTNVAMGGVQATIVALPANLHVVFEYPSGDFLPGNGSLPIRYTVTAADASVRSGRIVFRITTTAGATSEVALNVTVSPLAPQLAASTGLLQAAMLRGSQRTVEFEITNAGSATTGIVNVELPNVPWLTVATTSEIPSLQPGESASVTLLLTPAADLPLTAYNGNIVLRAVSGAYLSLPFTFRAVSDAQGDLVVTVVDELFYYTPEAPKVLNATVTLRDVLTGESITTTEVDGAGDYLLNDIREGYYALEVQATDHESYSATVFVAGGAPNVQLVFISQETVKYVWTVTETEIEDRTNITIESVFETNVPTPVVVIENPLIDLAPLEFVGDFIQVDMKITNHGLIAAQGLKLNFGTHPYYSFEPLISDIGVLPAKSSLTVPVIVRRVADETTGGGGGGGGNVSCVIPAWLDWSYECGPEDVRKTTGIAIINIDAQCGAFTPSGGTGIPGSVGPGSPGPGTVTPVVVETQAPRCDCYVDFVILNLDASSGELATVNYQVIPDGGTLFQVS